MTLNVTLKNNLQVVYQLDENGQIIHSWPSLQFAPINDVIVYDTDTLKSALRAFGLAVELAQDTPGGWWLDVILNGIAMGCMTQPCAWAFLYGLYISQVRHELVYLWFTPHGTDTWVYLRSHTDHKILRVYDSVEQAQADHPNVISKYDLNGWVLSIRSLNHTAAYWESEGGYTVLVNAEQLECTSAMHTFYTLQRAYRDLLVSN